MKTRKRSIVFVLGIMTIILLAFTSCSKDEEVTKQQPITQSEDDRLHTMFNNSVWYLCEDQYEYGVMELRYAIYGIEDGTIMRLTFSGQDSLLMQTFIGNWDDIFEQQAHFGSPEGFYTIDDSQLIILSSPNITGDIVNIVNDSLIYITFYSQNQTLKYEKAYNNK